MFAEGLRLVALSIHVMSSQVKQVKSEQGVGVKRAIGRQTVPMNAQGS